MNYDYKSCASSSSPIPVPSQHSNCSCASTFSDQRQRLTSDSDSSDLYEIKEFQSNPLQESFKFSLRNIRKQQRRNTAFNRSQSNEDVLLTLQNMQIPLLDQVFLTTQSTRNVIAVVQEEDSERVALAAEFVINAFQRREPRWERSHPTELAVIKILDSLTYYLFIISVIIAHCALIVYEPPSTTINGIDYNQWIFILELMFILLYIIDICLEMFAVGTRRWANKRWNLLFVLLVCLMFIETLVDMICPEYIFVRITRILRPWLLICKSVRLRQFTRRIIRSIPKMMPIFLVSGLVACTYASAGVALFEGDYRDKENEYNTQSFDTFGKGLLAMSVLTTTENYPDVLFLGFDNRPIVASIFFVSFIIIGSWVFLSLVLAIIFDFFKDQHLEEVSLERIREMQNLLLAYRLLSANSEIDENRFHLLMKEIDPTMDDERIHIIYYMLDTDKDDSVDIREFLFLTEYLHCNIECIDRSRNRLQAIIAFFHLPEKLVHFYDTIFAKIIIFVLTTGNLVLLVVYPGSQTERYSNLSVLSHIFLFFITLEIFLGCLHYGSFKKYWESDLFTTILVALSIPIEILGVIGIVEFAVVLVVRSLRFLRPIFIINQLKLMFLTMIYSVILTLDVFALLLIMMYSFSIIGMELFSASALGTESIPELEDFDSFYRAMFSLFQVSTTNNWNDVMYTALDLTSDRYAIYFLLYYFIVCMVLLSIMATVIVSGFTLVMQSSNNIHLLRVRTRIIEIPGEGKYRIRGKFDYSRAISQNELPPFNDFEMKGLQQRLEHIEIALQNRLENIPYVTPRVDLSGRQLLRRKMFFRDNTSYPDS